MKGYIALLRGINVGGKNSITMQALKNSFEALGFKQVRTYIQSGNVVFGAEETDSIDLERLIEQQIHNDFGYDVPVTIVTIKELLEAIKNNPYLDEKEAKPTNLNITFLYSEPAIIPDEKLMKKKAPDEKFKVDAKVFYLYCPGGYGKTKLSNTYLEKCFNTKATTRNWRTVNELSRIATDLNLT